MLYLKFLDHKLKPCTTAATCLLKPVRVRDSDGDIYNGFTVHPFKNVLVIEQFRPVYYGLFDTEQALFPVLFGTSETTSDVLVYGDTITATSFLMGTHPGLKANLSIVTEDVDHG